MFFYGSFMNAAVLKEGGFELGTFEVARLADFDVSAQPLITVVPAKDKVVYGISCLATPAELQRLYYNQWPYRADGRPDYWPEAVEVVSAVDDGKRWPALCYVSAQRAPGAPYGGVPRTRHGSRARLQVPAVVRGPA